MSGSSYYWSGWERLLTGKNVHVSNQNLLHNWYFGNPVNRNGLNEYAGNMLGIDRWRSTNARLTVTVNDGFLNLSATIEGHGYFRQSNNRALSGVLTFSALVRGDGAVQFNISASDLNTVLDSSNRTVSSDTWTLIEYTIDIENNSAYNSEFEYTSPYVRVNSGVNIDILAIKLEYGDTQTLAHQDSDGNWILNEIPDFTEQMAICQQYNATTGAYIGQSVPIDGSVAMSGNLQFHGGKGIVSCEYSGDDYSTQYIRAIDSTGSYILEVNKYGVRYWTGEEGNRWDKYYDIFGEHNKPSGAEAYYIGDGSATSRTIDTGGLGRVICVDTPTGLFLANPSGAIVRKGTTVYGLSNTECKFINGVLTLATTDTVINTSGSKCYYQVL